MSSWGEAPVIDLGLDRHVPDHDPSDWGRPRRPAALNRWALAGVLALVLLVVAGAAPPPQPPLSLVGAQPPAGTDGYALVGDQLFVMTGEAEHTLSAYRARDGRLLWSAPAPGSWLGAFRASAGLVLVITQPPREDCCEATAYDRATGRARWTYQVNPSDLDFDGNLLVTVVAGAKLVLEVSSGRVLWQGSDSTVVRLRGPHDVVLAYPDGTAERRDLSTGEIRASGRIHPADQRLSAVTLVDGEVIVGSGRAFQDATVAAYDADTLRPVWKRTGRLVDDASRCGRMLCLRAGYGLEAVDPRTGIVRWQQADWYALEQGGLVLAVTPAPGKLRAVAVVDPPTGRILLDLDGWDTNIIDSRDTSMVLTRASAGGTTVAVADLDRAVIHEIGVIPDLVSQCQVGNGRLACRDSMGRLQLWAYRR